MNYSIGQLARAFGVSRSTLLYYDRKGLLKASSRSAANYRGYSASDYERLKKIMTYRGTGLSLLEIKDLLAGDSKTKRASLLEARLDRLNGDIAVLRKQQQIIVDMLGTDFINRSTRSVSKSQWVKLMVSIGMSEEDMNQWHVEFERRMPEAHQDFLESLNINRKEIAKIRKQSR